MRTHSARAIAAALVLQLGAMGSPTFGGQPLGDRSKVRTTDLSPQEVKTGAVGGNPYPLALAGALKPLLLRNALGSIGGAGLKRVPQELVNLHYHCRGERTFAR